MDLLRASAQTEDEPTAASTRIDVNGLSAEVRGLIAGDAAAEMTLRARELDLHSIPAHAGSGTRIAAFFDIDGTLIRGSIAGHMFAQGVAEGRARRSSYLVFFLFFLLYKLNLIPRARMYRWGFNLGAGITVAEAIDFVRRCLRERIGRQVYLGAREMVGLHRSLGHRVVAVTGAPDYAAAQIASALGFDDVLATATPIVGERLGSEVREPICYGDGKIQYVRAYAAKHDLDLGRCYFYSDSRSDLPLLRLVGHPVCVNPQMLLWIPALIRRWDILLLRRLGEL
ncbi:MAG: HAD family hydrolase [Deltaproteobacteria bacterium]|nr:HAD family hydrolase [Deltaproteobacteria bacterium]